MPHDTPVDIPEIFRLLVPVANRCQACYGKPPEGTPVDPALSMVEQRIGTSDLFTGSDAIADWMRGRVSLRRPWQLRLDEPPGRYRNVRRLLAGCPDLAEWLTVANDRLDFRPEVPPSAWAAIEQYVAHHYTPVTDPSRAGPPPDERS